MEEGFIMNPITYRKQIQLLVIRFVMVIVVKIVIEQTFYETVGRQVLLNLVIRRLFHRLVFQRILYPIVVIKVPSWFAQIILLFVFITSRITIVGEKELERIKKEKQRVIFAFWHGFLLPHEKRSGLSSFILSRRLHGSIGLCL
jgi:hypothetical protein